jgi:hypothetical protein
MYMWNLTSSYYKKTLTRQRSKYSSKPKWNTTLKALTKILSFYINVFLDYYTFTTVILKTYEIVESIYSSTSHVKLFHYEIT